MNISFADLILVNIQIENFHFSLGLSQLLFWGIALVVGILTRLVFGSRFPFGVIGTIIVALIGIWIATDIILIDIPQDMVFYGSPLLKALAGAILAELCWYLIAHHIYHVWSRRRKAYIAVPPEQKQ